MLEKVQEDRAKKLQQLRDLGIDPYGWKYEGAESSVSIRERFDDARSEADGENPTQTRLL